ncbi:hypothetical protein DES53_12110 [Roseimicrobium gellanilyticum]|uniref:Pycsar effector protein domain-containing protein n=1 Tax=Roseimicrobium gellanilyticum TaxID=748857 RepID=A0A366H191_9BACT|nr:Pycsar system effector family protein [Roseimicrobium gellanilyticum]RBP35490.1 hypothetical protein DES53_12110 [Roseimicrobium gellanilyticum]
METADTFTEEDKVPVYPNLVTSDTPLRDTPLELTRIIQVLYADVEAQINRADLKAQIALSTSAILAALVANLGIGLATREASGWTGLDWAVVTLYTLFLTCACSSIVHALLAAYPRAVGRKDTHRGLPGLYFSGHVIQLPAPEYAGRFMDQTNRELLERVLVQIHSKSRVLEAKLQHVRWALRLLGMALLLWAISRAVVVIAHGRLPGT